MNDNDKNKKKIKIYYSLLVTVLCIIGVSYAFFTLVLRQTDNNTVASRTCFNTTLTEETERVVLENAYPIVDSEGLKGTPFTFKLKNNCSSYIRIYITIDSEHRGNLGTTYLDDNYIKVNISPKGTTSGQSIILGSKKLTELDNNRKGYIIINTGLQANEEKSYDLRLWMDENVTLEQGLGKSWEGKIVVIGEASDGITLNEAILADNEVVEPLTIPGKEGNYYTLEDLQVQSTGMLSLKNYYVTYGDGWEANGTLFNLTGVKVTNDTYANSYSSLIGKYLVGIYSSTIGSTTAGTILNTNNKKSIYYVVDATSDNLMYKELASNKNISEAVLASTEDDYGTSYYFRGTVKNNYVEFANKCWRIVRITGDGSIKLILYNNNMKSLANPCQNTDNSSDQAFSEYGIVSFAANNLSNDNAYIGFMYGTAGSSNYSDTHANINKSNALTMLETWYKKHLLSYNDKIADVIWCNDKSTFSTLTDGSSFGTGLGYGTNETGYGTWNRLNGVYNSNANPSLICPNDNNGGKLSKFTVSDTLNGNGSLTYKIGLLTADEVIFAGFPSSSSYITENTILGSDYWWLLSPYNYYPIDSTTGNPQMYCVFASSAGEAHVLSGYKLRPAIALTSETTISGGSGTSEDPYVVK